MEMVTFGAERRRGAMIAVAAALIGISVAIILAWRHTGGRINGSILIPAGVGIALLIRRSGGTIEYEPGRDEMIITRRTVVRSQVNRIAKSELRGLTIAPSGAVSELRFELEGGKHFVLLQSPDDAKLEPDRAAVSKFLLDHKLL